MHSKLIRILLLEDEAAHAEAIRRIVESADNNFSIKVVGSLRDYRESVALKPPDIALLDMMLPDGSALELLISPPEASAFPVLILTSHGNEQAAVAAMQAGALDYVVKSPQTFADIPHILDRVLVHWQLIQKHKQLEDKLSYQASLLENVSDAIIATDMGYNIVFWNKTAEKQYGWTASEVIGRPLATFIINDYLGYSLDNVLQDISRDGYWKGELTQNRRDGVRIPIATTLSIISNDARQPIGFVAVNRDITGRKKEEQALRESEQLLSNFVKHSPIYAFVKKVTSGESRVIMASENFQEITGIPASEMIGKTMKEMFPAELAAKMTADDYNVVSSGKVLELDEDLNNRNYSTIKFPIVRGGIQLLAGYIIDITEQKKAEEALLEAKEFSENLITSARDGISVLDTRGVHVDVNPALCEMTGFLREELIGVGRPHPYWPPEQYEEIDRNFQKTVAADFKDVELTFMRKNGERFPVIVSPSAVKDKHGNIISYFASVKDITERKQAEEDIRESEARYRELLDTAMDGFWLLDTQGHLLEVNQTYCHMSGYSEQELLAMSIIDLEATENAANTANHIQRVLEQGYDRFETRHRRKDGSLFDIEASVQYRDVEGGRMVVFMRDITERKQAEVENLRLREKAEMSSRLAAIGEMAAGIAHEINNPLTGVIGFSELLADRQDLPADVQEELKIISGGGNRVKDIVRRMLTFARQNKPVKASANINELIDNTLEIRSYVLRTANIEVIRNYDPSLPWVTVDPGQMQQVFLNLIVNAEYAMKKAHGKGTLVITTEKNDGHISISFKDDGMGMSQETKAKVFNPFFTTKQVNEGTGLGLSLSRSIILEHDGTIEVESEPGQGTTFIITLPVTPADEGKAPELTVDSQTSPENFKSARILVVDDEEGIRKLVSTILVKSGHVVDVTGDSVDAFEKLGSNTYDVIICDIRIPGMSGMEVYKLTLEAHPELTGKFIFITGDTSDETTRVFLEKNKLTYVTKPFDKNNLMKKVQELL